MIIYYTIQKMTIMGVINLNGNERRKRIVEMLLSAKEPLSGTTLSKALNVSRQVIVQDMALLRASDKNILSTNRGYMIFSSLLSYNTHRRCIKVTHDDSKIRHEMEIIVQCGGKMLDTIVEHEIYGQISVDLVIESMEDIDKFLAKKPEQKTLLSLTGGVHYHTIEAESEEALNMIEQKLLKMEEE